MVAQEARRQYEAEFDAEAQLLLGDVLAIVVERFGMVAGEAKSALGAAIAAHEKRFRLRTPLQATIVRNKSCDPMNSCTSSSGGGSAAAPRRTSGSRLIALIIAAAAAPADALVVRAKWARSSTRLVAIG